MVKFKELVNTSILDSEKWIGFFGDSEYINDNGEVEITGQKGYTLINSKGTICLITLYYK